MEQEREQTANRTRAQANVCEKYGITREELKTAVDEMCANGIARGCYQNTQALIAIVDLMTAGDISAEAKQ